ncbi:MAG TPA: 4Fe-4S dicluster domain-containing protein [Halanaerobiales bacterium]|nr:4Fe-4S dicluster domain-containing protein [Halanaerobiales bacterium]
MGNNTISEVVKIRRRVYTELVRLELENKLEEKIDKIPKKLINDDSPRHRCCEFKERAIIRDRIKLALGFDPEDYPEAPLSKLASKLNEVDADYNAVKVLEKACDSCPIDKYMVTDACRNCVAHKCVNACPKDAIVVIQNRAFIDQDKCIECGRCAKVCPYNAINENKRPCVRACAVDAITSDENRRAEIDDDKCVNCGSCIVACPFGAIDYISYIVQVLKLLKNRNTEVAALLAPSFTGQFGVRVQPEMVKKALKEIGFTEVVEVAYGADKVVEEESEEFLERMEAGKEVMTTSCCPGFKTLVNEHYPELSNYVSTTVSPMIKTADYLKEKNEEIKTIFIGPCIAKKSEAAAYENIDYVLTFEELVSIIVGFGINLEKMDTGEKIDDASKLGRIFPYSGGVSTAIESYLENKKIDIDNIKFEAAQGLDECKTKLEAIKENEAEFSFLEGMACEKGCVDGPGNLIKAVVAKKLVKDFADEAKREKIG